jgi:plastocyanin
MKRVLAAVALTGAVLGMGPHAGAQGGVGTVEGTVTLTSARGTPLAASAYGRRGVAPKPAAAGSEARKVIVYVAGVKPLVPPAPTTLTIAQENEQFVPPVAAVTLGSTVDFPNEDPYYHNVFSLSRAATFDLGRYPPGESRSRQLSKTGIVKVFCHLHSQMSALVMVLDHPYFAIPAESGEFRIASVPAGDYVVVAWHERIGERRERLRIPAGGTARVSFTLPVLETER